MYEPVVEHEGKRLYCVYEQFDERGNLLYTDEDHVTLSVYYLMEPEEEAVIIPPITVGLSWRRKQYWG